MKCLLVEFALVSVAILLFGCAGQAGENQNTNPDANNADHNPAVTADKIILIAPSQLPDGEVGTPYEYSFCSPAPGGKNDLCGGINGTANPSGGKGPYTFYLGSGTGFQQFGLALGLNGILAGTPAAAGTRSFQICAKDIGGDFACQPVSLNIKPSAGLAGVWDVEVNSVLNGPEGSFPAGCSMEQKMQLNLTQNGNAVGGTSTNKLTKTTDCGIWSVDIETPDKTAVVGTLSAPEIKFTMGATDFIGTIAGSNMTGAMETCHSPDARCTSSGMQQLNWYSGDFTAVRAG